MSKAFHEQNLPPSTALQTCSTVATTTLFDPPPTFKDKTRIGLTFAEQYAPKERSVVDPTEPNPDFPVLSAPQDNRCSLAGGENSREGLLWIKIAPSTANKMARDEPDSWKLHPTIGGENLSYVDRRRMTAQCSIAAAIGGALGDVPQRHASETWIVGKLWELAHGPVFVD